jgi:hypothetical protein
MQNICVKSKMPRIYLNPNPHMLGNLKSLFCKNENKSWMVEAKYF